MKETKVISSRQTSRKPGKTGKEGGIRTAVYCRVSTDSKAQSSSLEIQRSALKKRIQTTPGLILSDVYEDQGKSGGTIEKRKEFYRMLCHCREGKIDLIITKSISRFGRNLADTAAILRELKAIGIPVFFEKENLNTMDPSADIVISVLAAIAQEELNTHSRNIKWALQQKARLGNPGRPPCYGYRKSAKGSWEICVPEARKVQLIFQMAEKELLYKELLEKLNQMEKEEGSAYVWNRNRVYRILKKEEYMGDILTHKRISADYLTHRQVRNHGLSLQFYIRDHHKPIVERALYEKVQRILHKRCRYKRTATQTAADREG